MLRLKTYNLMMSTIAWTIFVLIFTCVLLLVLIGVYAALKGCLYTFNEILLLIQ